MRTASIIARTLAFSSGITFFSALLLFCSQPGALTNSRETGRTYLWRSHEFHYYLTFNQNAALVIILGLMVGSIIAAAVLDAFFRFRGANK